ncbi:MAG: leucine-rich repeat domain-containing protein [Ureaplasma sp.]|nr:leucine-rich repeat domain-containing protein [Ureaplasma sp.]
MFPTRFDHFPNIKNGSIQIEINNLIYCSEIKVSNLDNLQTSIINYINESSNKFTISEFESQLNSDNFKNRIATTIDTDKISIGNITYKDETLKIEPNLSINSNVKFSSTQSSLILVNGSLQLNIASSNFYTEIPIDDSTLINLRNEINNYLASNDMVTKNDINSYLMNEMYSFFQNTKTSNDKNLLDYVYSPTYSDKSITLKLKTNIGNYKIVVYQSYSNGILATNDTICLNNIQSPSIDTPQESPEEWFTWNDDGTQITGLSTDGQTQKRIVLPSKATSITNNAFYNNKTLVSVDMSLTKITSIPNSDNPGPGTFKDCTNLVSITLPPSLIRIGYQAFIRCSSLTSITIPETVTGIDEYAFYWCSSLTSITIPDSVKSITSYVFINCNSLTSINISKNVTWIGNKAFLNCSSLTSITIPRKVTSIRSEAFNGCSSLTSITMPNSVTSIGTRVFEYVPSTCVMNVSSTWDQTLATNAGYKGVFVID